MDIPLRLSSIALTALEGSLGTGSDCCVISRGCAFGVGAVLSLAMPLSGPAAVVVDGTSCGVATSLDASGRMRPPLAVFVTGPGSSFRHWVPRLTSPTSVSGVEAVGISRDGGRAKVTGGGTNGFSENSHLRCPSRLCVVICSAHTALV